MNQNEQNIFGMKFRNKLGTAAGLDKNGDYIDALGALGFGFLEVGTVTPRPQYGNPKPRIFRNYSENSIINRLGFNNKGIDYLVNNLKKRKYEGVVGVNIGANKSSNGNQRIKDYLLCIDKIHRLADYITINISSPNTPNLRDLHLKVDGLYYSPYTGSPFTGIVSGPYTEVIHHYQEHKFIKRKQKNFVHSYIDNAPP